jgi:Icc-related predicted phosphoesterase
VSQWFFTSDLHGQSTLYEQVVAFAAAEQPDAVILGGDLGPHANGAPGVQHQRVFLEGFLVEFARRLREATPNVELALLFGNDDWAANQDVLERHHGALWHALHGRSVRLQGHWVAGSSWVPITPFAMKDWERWEDGAEESPARLHGSLSGPEGVREFRFDPERRSPTIAEGLEALAAGSPPGDTIHVLHSPPRDTACDVIMTKQHVGSRAIRAYIEKHSPPLVLSGHIHESPRMSGAWRDAIGRTVCVNPGQFVGTRLSGVFFDPDAPAETLRHTVHE